MSKQAYEKMQQLHGVFDHFLPLHGGIIMHKKEDDKATSGVIITVMSDIGLRNYFIHYIKQDTTGVKIRVGEVRFTDSSDNNRAFVDTSTVFNVPRERKDGHDLYRWVTEIMTAHIDGTLIASFKFDVNDQEQVIAPELNKEDENG